MRIFQTYFIFSLFSALSLSVNDTEEMEKHRIICCEEIGFEGDCIDCFAIIRFIDSHERFPKHDKRSCAFVNEIKKGNNDPEYDAEYNFLVQQYQTDILDVMHEEEKLNRLIDFLKKHKFYDQDDFSFIQELYLRQDADQNPKVRALLEAFQENMLANIAVYGTRLMKKVYPRLVHYLGKTTCLN